MSSRRLNQALALLNQYIDDGLEFPDALAEVSDQLSLSEAQDAELTAAYDSQL